MSVQPISGQNNRLSPLCHHFMTSLPDFILTLISSLTLSLLFYLKFMCFEIYLFAVLPMYPNAKSVNKIFRARLLETFTMVFLNLSCSLNCECYMAVHLVERIMWPWYSNSSLFPPVISGTDCNVFSFKSSLNTWIALFIHFCNNKFNKLNMLIQQLVYSTC